MKSRFGFIFPVMVIIYGCGVSGGSGDASGYGTTVNSDSNSPTIVVSTPSDHGKTIPTDATLSVIFSEAMRPSSINSDTFRIRQHFSNISGTFSFSPTCATVTFKPLHNLSPFHTYTAEVTTGTTDLAGNVLMQLRKWSFTTGGSTSTARFADVQQIFNANCTVCHQSGGQSAFLPLTYEIAYENLVGRPSAYTTGGILVLSGYSSASESVLYKRITGNVVPQMPLNPPFLNSTSQNLIKVWINEGALNN